MLIIGAKGFAKEVLETLYVENKYFDRIYFYDDVNDEIGTHLYGKFEIIKDIKSVNSTLGDTFDFTVGIGNPLLRQKVIKKFTAIGGRLQSVISSLAKIGSFDTSLEAGANIMAGTIITNSVRIGKAPLVNLNCTIGHDCIVGDFLEMSPGSHISGNCTLGDYVNIGTNVTILPKITIGSNVIIGANSVVTKDIMDNCLVVGVPAKVIKNIDPI